MQNQIIYYHNGNVVKIYNNNLDVNPQIGSKVKLNEVTYMVKSVSDNGTTREVEVDKISPAPYQSLNKTVDAYIVSILRSGVNPTDINVSDVIRLAKEVRLKCDE